MENFNTLEDITKLYKSAEYINLSTRRADGSSHPSQTRVFHGRSKSLYFITEIASEKSKGIRRDPVVSGSLLIPTPKPGEGVNFYFNGLAEIPRTEDQYVEKFPGEFNEVNNALSFLTSTRKDYKANPHPILCGYGNSQLHRIMIKDAWYNGGMFSEEDGFEHNAAKNLRIVTDTRFGSLTRRFVEVDKPLPEHSVEIPCELLLSGKISSVYKYSQ